MGTYGYISIIAMVCYAFMLLMFLAAKRNKIVNSFLVVLTGLRSKYDIHISDGIIPAVMWISFSSLFQIDMIYFKAKVRYNYGKNYVIS